MNPKFSRRLKFLTPNRSLTATTQNTSRANLDFARQTIMDDVGPIPVVSTRHFIKTSMPKDLNSFTPENLRAIKKKLIDADILRVDVVVDEKGNETEVESWVEYQKPPSQHKGDEDETFRSYKTIYNNVSAAAREVCKDRDATNGEPAIARFEIVGNSNLLSETNNSSRCDAALVIDDAIYELSDLDKNLLPKPGVPKPKRAGGLKIEKEAEIIEDLAEAIGDLDVEGM